MHFLVNLPRYAKQILTASLDAVCLPIIFVITLWLRYDWFGIALIQHYAWILVALPVISLPIFMRLGLYRAVIRFIDQKILSVAAIGVTIAVLVLGFLTVMMRMTDISRSVFGVYWAAAIVYVISSRFIARAWLLRAEREENLPRVIIYGAGRAGIQLATALRAGNEATCVALIDDNSALQGSIFAGFRVYGPHDLPLLIKKRDVKEILLAMPSISKARQKQILDQLEPLKVKIRVTPSIKSLLNGELRVQDVREVEIEDLLGREIVEPDPHLLSACIQDLNVCVTGAGGSIGSELCRQILKQQPRTLILFEVSEFALYSIEQELQQLRDAQHLKTRIIPMLGSVTVRAKLEKLLREFKVDSLYHAAAYKHVPLVEHNPIEGVQNNVFGTLNVAQAAIAAQVKNFVLISTDKAVRPTNVMGATKRLAELVLQALSRQSHRTRFTMVRFGNVLGSSGSVVPLFRKQIMAGGPITLTHPEITRYFMTIPEAANLVLQAGAMGAGGDVFVLDMGEPVRIIDLARRMIHLSGLEVKSDATPDGTIEIHHVGLRPGEKLYEELLIGDNVEGTPHPLIMRAQEYELTWDELQLGLNELQTACDNFDYLALRAGIQKWVHEYQPQCGIEDWLWQQQNSVQE